MKKIAFIGAGFTSQICHLPNYHKQKKCRIIALVEKRQNLGSYICKKYNIKNLYTDYKEMLSKHKSELDGVVIIVRREEVFEISRYFLKNKINVFSEKPMAKTYSQGKKLVTLSKKNNLIYQVGNNKVYDEGVKTVKKLLENEKNLGKIIYFRYQNIAGNGYIKDKKYYLSNDTYHNTKKKDRKYPDWLSKKLYHLFDEYLNTNIHTVNLLNFLFNEQPNIEYVKLKKTNQLVVLNYNSFFGTIESKHYKDYDYDTNLKIFFENGYIKITLPLLHQKNGYAKIIYKKRNESEKTINVKKSKWSFDNQAIQYIKNLYTKKININSGESSLLDNLVIENIFKFNEKKNI
jgi:predicted dehydrogenase